MIELIRNSTFFGVVITLVTYEIGLFLKRKFHSPVFNPMLIAIILVILFLLGSGIDYETYNEGAKYISFLLTPATVCLAIPLYEQIMLLKRHFKAIIAGIFSGVLTSCISIYLMSLLFGFEHYEYVTMLPKSITTAIGMGISEELGGVATITVAVIVITGVFGNMIAELVCRLFRIDEPVARGVGIGSASHAMGTAKAMEMGEVEGAMSSLSIVVAGIITVVVANIFAGFL
jgi:predicted murein hydrolase (TIGR00659 family)